MTTLEFMIEEQEQFDIWVSWMIFDEENKNV